MKDYILPGSEIDNALVALRSAIGNVMDPKHRERLIDEATLSDFIDEISDEVLELCGYLRGVREEAQERADAEYILDRLGGFA